jgi:cellulose synthase operon protein YhjQ
MPILCVQGIQGSVGNSTVVANVARLLQELNQDVLVFDLNPNNLLRLHFNMDWQNPVGWASHITHKKPWYQAAFKCEQGVQFIPFGTLDYTEYEHLIHEVIYENWLSQQLENLNFPASKWIILNTSNELNTLSVQALNACNMIIRVCTPDLSCLSQLVNSIQSNYINSRPELSDKAFFLINKLSAVSQLENDLSLVFKNLMQKKLIPVNVHDDENIKEAFAFKSTVSLYASKSAATKELRSLAIWLLTQFNVQSS